MTTPFARELRDHGISVSIFAARAGCSKQWVRRLVNGTARPSKRLLSVLGEMKREPTLEQKIAMKVNAGIERNMPVLLSPRELRCLRNKSFLIAPADFHSAK